MEEGADEHLWQYHLRKFIRSRRSRVIGEVDSNKCILHVNIQISISNIFIGERNDEESGRGTKT